MEPRRKQGVTAADEHRYKKHPWTPSHPNHKHLPERKEIAKKRESHASRWGARVRVCLHHDQGCLSEERAAKDLRGN